ncbi:hypothetical protein EDD21DRAFT_207938 [Dissophora ornata]|nr:hypothetical protein EDD21DRAFT_207938 [Dissophora ornata]
MSVQPTTATLQAYSSTPPSRTQNKRTERGPAMPLIRTNTNELSELFQPYFENCPPAMEKAATVPIERHENPITLTNLPQIVAQGNSPVQGTGSTMLLDLSRLGDANLFETIADDFYAHTRDKADYDITSIYLLRNPVAWRRYQAEKQIGRQGAQGEEDPAMLFRDEILYHGTHQRCVPSILLHGIDPRMAVRANYGKGIYMSDSIEKCMQYVDKQTTIEQEYSVVLCCALLGKVIVEPYDKSKRKLDQHALFMPEGYHSGVAHDVFKEWVINSSWKRPLANTLSALLPAYRFCRLLKYNTTTQL